MVCYLQVSDRIPLLSVNKARKLQTNFKHIVGNTDTQ